MGTYLLKLVTAWLEDPHAASAKPEGVHIAAVWAITVVCFIIGAIAVIYILRDLLRVGGAVLVVCLLLVVQELAERWLGTGNYVRKSINARFNA